MVNFYARLPVMFTDAEVKQWMGSNVTEIAALFEPLETSQYRVVSGVLQVRAYSSNWYDVEVGGWVWAKDCYEGSDMVFTDAYFREWFIAGDGYAFDNEVTP